MMPLYDIVCHQCSQLVTNLYSTSFSGAIQLLHPTLRQPIYDIYGFVRFADEIVDTLHDYNKETLLNDFIADTQKAIAQKVSLNPILHSFQQVVHTYNIPQDLITAFLHSMSMDLHKTTYHTPQEMDEYVYGSAEVVGLMCLCVFCKGDIALYEQLKHPARKLGAAFQKINFLRDIRADFKNLNRTYFPNTDFNHFDVAAKQQIEADIEKDFKDSLSGIHALPKEARIGVYTAYKYYYALFKKIKKIPPQHIMEHRVRVSDLRKLLIVMGVRMGVYIHPYRS